MPDAILTLDQIAEVEHIFKYKGWGITQTCGAEVTKNGGKELDLTTMLFQTARAAHKPQMDVWEQFALLDADERLRLMQHYCVHCGCNNPRCHCWNDE